MSAYKWVGAVFSVDANEVGKELELIQEEEGGITSASMVDRARDESSPLHKLFEWNDKVAGEKYRLMQAGVVLGSLTIVRTDKTPETRAFVNVKGKSFGSGRFIDVDTAMADEEMRRIVLRNAYNEMESFRRKYTELSELKGVIKEINLLIPE